MAGVGGHQLSWARAGRRQEGSGRPPPPAARPRRQGRRRLSGRLARARGSWAGAAAGRGRRRQAAFFGGSWQQQAGPGPRGRSRLAGGRLGAAPLGAVMETRVKSGWGGPRIAPAPAAWRPRRWPLCCGPRKGVRFQGPGRRAAGARAGLARASGGGAARAETRHPGPCDRPPGGGRSQGPRSQRGARPRPENDSRARPL